MSWGKDCWKDKAKVANTNKASPCRSVLAGQCQVLGTDIPGAGALPWGLGSTLCHPELGSACVCNPPAGFHRSSRNRAELKGISRSNFQAGILFKDIPSMGYSHQSGAFGVSDQRRLSMTQSTPRELQCLSPFTHLWVAKSFLKLLVCSPWFDCYKLEQFAVGN